MFKFDIVEHRRLKQVENYELVNEALESCNISVAKKRGNPKAYERVLKYLKQHGVDEKELLKQCFSSPIVRGLLAISMAKLSSRQEGGDYEKAFFEGIDSYTSKFGVRVKSLSNNELRPLKTGGFYEGDTDLNIQLDALKTIDASISGKIEGYIFAKGMTGYGGGHQGNVLIESHDFLNWAEKEPKNKLYVVLFDGDGKHKDLPKLLIRDKVNPNIWVCDHIKFQERIEEKVKNVKG